jgi:glucosamine kinase
VVATSAWQRDGLFGEGNVARLLDLVRHDLDDQHRTPLAVGAHGCDSVEQVQRFDAQVRSEWAGPVRVVNDAELLGPASGHAEAICLIVGTGSIVIGRTAEDEPVYVGGHGWLLDDYGSAPGITREAVRAVLAAVDAASPRDGLAEALLQHFGVGSEVELSLFLTAHADIATWAAPAPLVFACADAGSTTALRVVDEAAARLARDLARARARGAVGTTAVTAGGVVTNQPRLFEAIARHLAVHDRDLTLELLTVAPVVGALALAHHLADLAEHGSPAVNDNRGGTR